MRIALDRGGTFLDAYVSHLPNDKPDKIFKLLSVDPKNYQDAPTEAIRRILQYAYDKEIPRGEKLDTSGIETIRLSTTVATNALLERKGQKHALVTTRGFKVSGDSRSRADKIAHTDLSPSDRTFCG